MRCPHCGKVPYPIRTEEKYGEKRQVIWKNLFKMDWAWLLLFIIVIVLVVAYNHDTAECRDLIENPCDYVEQFDCKEINYVEGIGNEKTIDTGYT